MPPKGRTATSDLREHGGHDSFPRPQDNPLAGTVRLYQLITNVEGVVVQFVHGVDSHPAQ